MCVKKFLDTVHLITYMQAKVRVQNYLETVQLIHYTQANVCTKLLRRHAVNT